ncbi:glycogen debranching protein GlgX [Arsukibacterium sp.]|uniref:glycogen debranching protein GlgX n=1 Tax=Arsukibacterium sp. TaxID=1977258 RepID=UPI003566653B
MSAKLENTALSAQISHGNSYPLGPSLVADNCWNFAVFAPDAAALVLCLYRPDTEEQLAELVFTGRTGSVWHVQVSGIVDGTLYALKADGTFNSSAGLRFDKERVLIDPYSRKLNRPQVWQAEQYLQKSHLALAKGVLDVAAYSRQDTGFDWQGSCKPNIAREKTVIYEAHVKGLTMQHPDVPDAIKGTYLGVCHASIIRHLKQLGITSVQLLPVAAFMAEPRLTGLGLTNYWGYNPVNFFAPDPRYQREDAVAEFKEMVRTLHQHGLEVILDVVFNHSAEAGDDGPVLSFRGLADRHYYLFHSHADLVDYQNYCNFTGCGNTFNIANPATQRLVMDALRYWLTEMQVDGFRFDLAVTLGREHKRFNPYASFFQIVAQDPVLSQAKLIAEPWDVGPFGYHLGQFPANWSELNDKCRDTFRAFWRGDKGVLAEFATRLLGSRDIFQKHHKPASCSVNYLTYHDGFTLDDLVSYSDKHNWQNGEQNRDGHSHNLSCNHGIEGATTNPVILARRYQHKRNLAATLLLSQGMIHWLGGDELSHTQGGNNNAYCQDNPISWLSWQLNGQQQKFQDFICQLLQLRRKFSCLQQLSLQDDQYQLHGDKHQVCWFLADGTEKQQHDWHDPLRAVCIFRISNRRTGEALLFVFNGAEQSIELTLPTEKAEGGWQRVFDTAHNDGLKDSNTALHRDYLQSAHSISVWQ